MDKMHAHTLRTVLQRIDEAKTVWAKAMIALRYMLYSAPILLEAIENHDCGKVE